MSDLSPLSTMPKAPAPPTEQPAPPASYEAAVQELETLVANLEGGQLPLDQLLVSYQRGAELLAYCQSKLQQVEQQIKVLDEGMLKPWTPSA
jgi:exodeoxyribonuclease VII small subunit